MDWDDLEPWKLGQGGTDPHVGGARATGGCGDTGGYGETGATGGTSGGPICDGGPYDDCDGDGWLAVEEDCCDQPGFCSTTPELINPGAFEYVCNAVDEDCDGLIDNIDPPCDGLLNNSNSPIRSTTHGPWICATSPTKSSFLRPVHGVSSPVSSHW